MFHEIPSMCLELTNVDHSVYYTLLHSIEKCKAYQKINLLSCVVSSVCKRDSKILVATRITVAFTHCVVAVQRSRGYGFQMQVCCNEEFSKQFGYCNIYDRMSGSSRWLVLSLT